MGIEALTHRDDGTLVVPTSDADWADWVGATDTRNFILKDPILDWLEEFGTGAGFQRDTELPTYDVRTNFPLFVLGQSAAFESAVVAHIGNIIQVVRLSERPDQVRDLEVAKSTFLAMEAGTEAIYRGVLWDAENRAYGVPDLLVRSDKLLELFPGSISDDEMGDVAPDLDGAEWHYVVVDIKFERLPLNVNGDLSNSGSARADKSQLFIYNRALGRIQGLLPNCSFILGRGWELQSKGVRYKGDNCMDSLAPVRQDESGQGGSLETRSNDAIAWLRKLRANGTTWKVLPKPLVPELWPNMNNAEDFPWHAAKSQIADQLGELTNLWQVRPENRDAAHKQGVESWSDPNCDSAMVGVKGASQGPSLQAILDVNHSKDDKPIRPATVGASRDQWYESPSLEFYVDFETVSDLADDFTGVPDRGGQPLIFMIGCGHVEGGNWIFECFIADSLTEASEKTIIDEWYLHMRTVNERLGPFEQEPRLIHWSNAEPIWLETGDISAFERHNGHGWPPLPWFDFLSQVVQKEPVVVRGALDFGLKEIAKAMKSVGVITTQWDEGPTDGLGAMAGAWWCAEEAAKLGVPMKDLTLMQDISKYNEVDCKVMMEIVQYLRDHH